MPLRALLFLQFILWHCWHMRSGRIPHTPMYRWQKMVYGCIWSTYWSTWYWGRKIIAKRMSSALNRLFYRHAAELSKELRVRSAELRSFVRVWWLRHHVHVCVCVCWNSGRHLVREQYFPLSVASLDQRHNYVLYAIASPPSYPGVHGLQLV